MRRVPLIAFKQPVDYPLETNVFDINNLSAVHASSNDDKMRGKHRNFKGRRQRVEFHSEKFTPS